jgi:hypothetical protein
MSTHGLLEGDTQLNVASVYSAWYQHVFLYPSKNTKPKAILGSLILAVTIRRQRFVSQKRKRKGTCNLDCVKLVPDWNSGCPKWNEQDIFPAKICITTWRDRLVIVWLHALDDWITCEVRLRPRLVLTKTSTRKNKWIGLFHHTFFLLEDLWPLPHWGVRTGDRTPTGRHASTVTYHQATGTVSVSSYSGVFVSVSS